VGETDEQAHADAEESTMRSYRRLAQNFLNSATVAGATPDEERVERGHRLSAVTYEDLLRDRLAYGNPDTVTKLMREIIDELGLDGIVAEVNVGGGISRDKVLVSVKRFATEVAPNLR
jgi:alkanesulfonate monooxygenase SsuD/methylene tetrahydromethanopterin reductase-like flavin-dependent oxidoreductase (luciferase family)